MNAPAEFTCEICGKTLLRGTPEAKMDAEAKVIFGIENASKAPAEEVGTVCDPCFKIFMEWYRTESGRPQ